MTPTQSAFIAALGVAIWIFGAWSAWRLVVRRNAKADAAAAAVGDGAVALRRLDLRGGPLFGGQSTNSWSPRLSILPEGLRFKVVWTEHQWAFARIGRVDATRSLYGPAIVFVSDGRRLTANVADRAAARQVLLALPRDLPLTARAVALRDAG